MGRFARLVGLVLLIGAVAISADLGHTWMVSSADRFTGRILGIEQALAFPSQFETVSVGADAAFSPRAAVLESGGTVTFANKASSALLIRAAARSPATFAVHIGPHRRVDIRLVHPGLYHYYDALSSRPLHVVANNQVIISRHGTGPARQGWIAVLPRVPGLHARLTVPAGQDLFMPEALVAVVGSAILVENRDSDAHNFVVDPASPAGAAFIIDGSDAEPPGGWRRLLVVQEPGLYHVYCTFHTRVVGVQGGWHAVVPVPKASGFRDHDPMEAWIVVLPATA